MAKKPNILLLFSDQFRWDAIHAINNSQLLTPNLDRLCRDGVIFNRAYSPCPVCVPARISKFMGQYPFKTGVFDNDYPFEKKQKNLMEVLRDNGYNSKGIGKMHFVPDGMALNGFDSRDCQEEISGESGDGDYRTYLNKKGYSKVFDSHGERSEMYYIPQISLLPEEDHPTNWIGDRSVSFINNYTDEKPFFLMSSFVHPHPPFSPPTPWNKIYRVPEIQEPFVPENYEELLVYVNHFQNRYKYRDDGIDRKLILTMRAFYYACISFIDYQVGKIIEALENRGILDETLIVFTSDHGEMLGDYNSFGKRCMLDPAARIPFIARYPKMIQSAGRCDTPVSLIDLFPTFIDAAGIEKTDEMELDGESIMKVLDGSSQRKTVYSQYCSADRGLYMAVNEFEKLIYSAPDDKYMYFDTRVSKLEDRNLWDDYSCKDKALDMKAGFVEFLAANHPEALEKGDFKRYPVKHMPENKDEGLLYQDNPVNKEAESVIPKGYRVTLKL
ncbi:MAG: sulfatase family protein [Saccharofermentanales bacterium]